MKNIFGFVSIIKLSLAVFVFSIVICIINKSDAVNIAIAMGVFYLIIMLLFFSGNCI